MEKKWYKSGWFLGGVVGGMVGYLCHIVLWILASVAGGHKWEQNLTLMTFLILVGIVIGAIISLIISKLRR